MVFPGTPRLAIPARNMEFYCYQHCAVSQRAPDLKMLGDAELAKAPTNSSGAP